MAYLKRHDSACVLPVSRRSFLGGAAALTGAAAAGLPLGARASNWQPMERIEIVVPVGAGGGTDTTARMIQQILLEEGIVQQSITIANMPGGGGAIGMEYLANQAPDGHTICIHSSQIIQSHVSGRAPLTHTDVTPLALLARQVVSFAVNADSDIEDAQDLVDRLKADPQSLSFSVGAAAGSINHLALAKVARSIGVDPLELRTVVFASVAEGATALLGGHLDVAISSSEQFLPHMQSGDARIVAVAAEERMGGDLAEVPTWAEYGVDCVDGNWYCAFGPAGMSAETVAYWDEVFGALAASERWRQMVADRNMPPGAYLDSAATAAFFEQQYEETHSIMTELGLAV